MPRDLLRKLHVSRYAIFLIALVLSLVVARRNPFSVKLALGPSDIKQAEFFPFSSFPMYSGFSPRPFVVYVADGDGNPIASLLEFGVRTSVLKKDYERRIKRIKKETGISLENLSAAQKQPAALATLNHLLDTLASRQREGPVQLWEVVLTRENGTIVRRSEMIAEIDRTPGAHPPAPPD